MKKSLLVSMMAVAFLAAAMDVQAVYVRNNSSGTLVFFDDFEGGTVNSLPDNGAYPGTWSVIAGTSPNPSVRNQATAPDGQAPYDGDQMLYVNVGANTGGSRASFSSPLTAGDNMHFELALWNRNNANSYSMGLRFLDTAETIQTQFYNESGYVGAAANGGGNYNALLWLPNAWNVFEVDHVVGSTEITVTLNGTSITRNIPAAYTNLAHIEFRQVGGSASFLVDNTIPEPATLALLGLGGLVMLRRRR